MIYVSNHDFQRYQEIKQLIEEKKYFSLFHLGFLTRLPYKKNKFHRFLADERPLCNFIYLQMHEVKRSCYGMMERDDNRSIKVELWDAATTGRRIKETDLYFQIGYGFYLLRDYIEAEIWMNRILEVDPWNSNASTLKKQLTPVITKKKKKGMLSSFLNMTSQLEESNMYRDFRKRKASITQVNKSKIQTKPVVTTDELLQRFPEEDERYLTKCFYAIRENGSINKRSFHQFLGVLGEGYSLFTLDFVFDSFTNVTHLTEGTPPKDPRNISIETFLMAMSVFINGSIKERLTLSFHSLDIENKGYLIEEDIFVQVSRICLLLESIGIEVKSPVEITQTLWSKISENASEGNPVEKFSTDSIRQAFQNQGSFHDQAQGDQVIVHRSLFIENCKKNLLCIQSLGLNDENDITEYPNSGRKIAFGGKNYSEFINSMIGIRIVLQRLKKTSRPVIIGDYDTEFKIQLPGHVTTPSYFTAFAPHVFGKLREHFQITEDSLVTSFSPEYFLGSLLTCHLSSFSSMRSPGKSGSSFYYSQDSRFLIKSILQSEVRELKNLLPHYYAHLMKYNKTFLSKILGFFQLNTTFYIVMENFFKTKRKIHQIFDLKGSSIARSNPMGPVYKDLDMRFDLIVGEEMALEIKQMLTEDVSLLFSQNLTDYSLLVGVHRLSEIAEITDVHCGRLKDGGIISSDGTSIYYIGVIDILTDYNIKKSTEKNFKTALMPSKKSQISAADPQTYFKRWKENVIGKFK